MASITARKDKNGKIISYRMRHYRGKGVKPFEKTVKLPPELSKRERDKELKRLEVEFDRECELKETNYNLVKSFKNYTEHFLSIKKMCGVKETTYANYSAWCARINETLGAYKLEEITPKLLTDYYASLLESGLSPSSIKIYHRLIHGIFEQAENEGEIVSNPARRAVTPRVEKHAARSLEKEELQEVLEALSDEDIMFKTLSILLIYTGCRRGEIIGLKWSDIDFEKRVITIERNVTVANSKISITTPKTSKSERLLSLPPNVMHTLAEYKAHQSALIEELGGRYHDEGWLFTRRHEPIGEVLHPLTYYTWLSNFCKRHGFSHINPHEFRHTSASILINSGLDVVTVSKRLGHSSTSTTLNIYSHALQTADEKACEVFAEAIELPEQKAQ